MAFSVSEVSNSGHVPMSFPDAGSAFLSLDKISQESRVVESNVAYRELRMFSRIELLPNLH